MNESLLILSEDEVFSRMLELEFRMHRISVRTESASDRQVSARVILVDLDTVLPPAEAEGRIIGFTRSFSITAADPERRCSLILHRPFSMELLTEEILALIPTDGEAAMPLRVGGSRGLLELRDGTLFFGERSVCLSPMEKKVMDSLLSARPQVLSRAELCELLGESSANKTEVYICFLRKKLEELTGSAMIRTVRGVGYRLE